MFLRCLSLSPFFLFLLSVSDASASLPEPSFVIYGVVESASGKVRQEGIYVSVVRSGEVLADDELDVEGDFEFYLEVPLEASIGSRSATKARVGDVLELKVSGVPVSNVLVAGRGMLVEHNLALPEGYDSDGDGIDDTTEFANALRPDDPNDPVTFGDMDIDGDGLANGREYMAGTYDPYGDFDGDGFSNNDEYVMSADPASALSMPAQYADLGLFAPLNINSEAFDYLKTEYGSDYVWDEQVNGIPVSIVPALWNVDERHDLIISTTHGKLFYCEQVEGGGYKSPELISLFSVPVSGRLYVGFADVDGVNSEELWAYSAYSGILYVFSRSSLGVPYGQDLWMQIPIGDIAGDLDLADVNGDGIPDVLASGLSLASEFSLDSISLLKGGWDGVNFTFSAPEDLVTNERLDGNSLMVFSNIGEVGFDTGKDYLIRMDDTYAFSLSYNGGLATSFVKNDPVLSYSGSSQVTPGREAPLYPVSSLSTGSSKDAWVFFAFDEDRFTDLLQYMGSFQGFEGKFRVVKGFHSVRDSDGDGLEDFRDVDKNDPDVPLPNGDRDFDGDGIPYAIDGSRSGQEDADGDGMKDAFELMYGLNPVVAADVSSDADGDGRTALEEYIDQTDPSDSNSVLAMQVSHRSTINTFSTGVSDMLVVGDDVIVASVNERSLAIYSTQDYQRKKMIETNDQNGVSKILKAEQSVVVGTVGGGVEIWDTDAAVRIALFELSDAAVTDMVVDGKDLYTLHANGYVYHWDLEKLIYVSHWYVYEGVLTNMHANSGTLYIQSSVPEKIVFVWDVESQKQIYTITGRATCCSRTVSAKNKSDVLLANSFSNTGIYSMNLTSYSSHRFVDGIDVSAMKVNDDTVYVGRRTGIVDRYSLSTGSFIDRVAASSSQVRQIEFVNGGFLSLHSDGKLYFWE